MHVQALPSSRIHPAVQNASARKDQRVGAVTVEDGELKIAVEGRTRNGLPHDGHSAQPSRAGIDLNQKPDAAGSQNQTEGGGGNIDLDQLP
jgi:hypothetical protein